MCGIAGILNLNGESVSPAVLQKITDAIAHRGPDDEGHWIEGNVGLGHRRLVQNRIGCTKKAERDLGFKYQYDLKQGLQRLIDWREKNL